MALNRTVLAREHCGQLAFSLVVSIAALMSFSDSSAQHIEDGQLVFPERRITAFAYLGADEEVLRATALKITTREGDVPRVLGL